MGNYLLSLRAPPPAPGEEEKNHPLYYNWQIAKYRLFREDPKSSNEADKGQVVVETQKSTTTKEPLSSEVSRVQKDKLTSTVDMNSTKPPNLDTHKSTSMKSGSSGKSASSSSSIKKVDVQRPHTVDPKKYGTVEKAAAIKAATNIHTIEKTAKTTKTTKSGGKGTT